MPPSPSRMARLTARDAACLPGWTRRPLGTLALAAILGCLLTACRPSSPSGAATTGPVIAEVGSRSILADDLVAEARRRQESRRPLPAREELLRELTGREALLQRARQAGLDRDPAYLREIESLLIRRLQAAELDPQREAVTIPDAAIQAEYEATRDRYTRPPQARLAMLFLAADPRSGESRKAALRARLDEGRRLFLARTNPVPGETMATPGFGALAVDFSDDQVTRHRGGDLGWLEPGRHPARLPAHVAETAWDLPAGQVSPVLEARDGFYVVLKSDAREASVTPLESVQASIRQTLLVRRRQEIEEAFRTDTARMIPILIHTQALATVSLPEPLTTLAARNREPQPPVLPGTTEPSHGN